MATSAIARRRSSAVVGMVPTRLEAELLSGRLLANVGTRWAHVRTAGLVAEQLHDLLPEQEHRLLVAAATLHDIGYSPEIAHTGFHPLDGAIYLRDQGFCHRLARLVANHSHARLVAVQFGICDLSDLFPAEDSLLSDALAYCDMHSGPDGELIASEDRLADIATRHADPVFADRADVLRASLSRVARELSRTVEAHGPHGTWGIDVPSELLNVNASEQHGLPEQRDQGEPPGLPEQRG